GEKDEGQSGHDDEDRRQPPGLVVQDARHVIHRRADVGEDDRPAEERAEPLRRDHDFATLRAAATIAAESRPSLARRSSGLPERGRSRTARLSWRVGRTAAATASPSPPQAAWSSTVIRPRVSATARASVASSSGFTE